MLWKLFNRDRTVTVQNIAPPAGLENIAFDATPGAGERTTVEREGVFVTPQSLASFAGATGVVTLIWKALGMLQPQWGQAPVVALLISFVIAAIIYLINESDPAAPTPTPKQRLISISVAVVNSFVIFSAAVGTSVTILPK